MNRFIKIFAAVVFAMVVSTSFAMAGTLDEIQKRGKLRVGMEPGNMPFILNSQKGEIIGFDVDMSKHMAKAMGVDLELVSTAWDGIIPALLADKFDVIISGMTLTQERNMTINFTSPYFETGQSILLNNKIAAKINSYKNLNDPKYTVGSKLGTTGEQAIKRMIPKAKHESYKTEQEGVLQVVTGKIDAFVYDMPYNTIAVSKHGQGKVTHLAQAFTFEALAWGVRKGDHDFLNWLNNFMYQIKKDGTYNKIHSKWFQNDAWLKEIQ